MKTMIRILVVMMCLIPAMANAGSRDVKKFGVFGGLISSPMPSIYGVNVGYNLLRFMRMSAGVGFIKATAASGVDASATLDVDVKTYNAEAKFMLPDWNFTPMLTAGYSLISGTITGSGTLSSLGGMNGTGGAMYIGGGFDWQTGYGLNIGFEYKQMMTTGGTGLPGLYLGWYF